MVSTQNEEQISAAAVSGAAGYSANWNTKRKVVEVMILTMEKVHLKAFVRFIKFLALLRSNSRRAVTQNNT